MRILLCICIGLALNSCGEDSKGGGSPTPPIEKEKEDESPVQKAGEIRMLFANEQLPECAEESIGATYYVYNESTFKYCSEGLTWEPIDLTGSQGDQGEKGDKGDKGDPGANGEKGEPGDPGVNGAVGATGDPGQPAAPGWVVYDSNGMKIGIALTEDANNFFSEYNAIKIITVEGFAGSVDFHSGKFVNAATKSNIQSCHYTSIGCDGDCLIRAGNKYSFGIHGVDSDASSRSQSLKVITGIASSVTINSYRSVSSGVCTTSTFTDNFYPTVDYTPTNSSYPFPAPLYLGIQ